MYTFKKIRAGDAANKAVFPFQLLTLAVMTALTWYYDSFEKMVIKTLSAAVMWCVKEKQYDCNSFLIH